MTPEGPSSSGARQPPDSARQHLPAQRPTWPTFLGLGAILFGAAGAITSLPAGCAFSLAPSLLPTTSAEPLRGLSLYLTLTALINTALSILLLVAGIGLCQRRPWAVTLLWNWAVLNLGMTALAAVAVYTRGHQLLAALQTHIQDLLPPLVELDLTKLSAALALALLLIGWSSPLFILLWFARPSIRRQTAAWTSCPTPK